MEESKSWPPSGLSLILLLCLGLFVFPALAQENVLIKGKVEADSLDASTIHVVNLTQERGTTTLDSGTFYLHARLNDSLLFSSVQYKNLKLRITEEMMESKELRVRLELEMHELEEVVITNHELSGDLTRDVENLEMFDQGAVGFPLSESSAPPPGSTGRKIQSAGNSPVELLVNTLNGNLKKLKKLQAMEKQDAWVDRGLEAVALEFLTDELSVPEAETWLFVYYCSEDGRYRSLVRENNPLNLMEFYAEKTEGYMSMRSEIIEALESEEGNP